MENRDFKDAVEDAMTAAAPFVSRQDFGEVCRILTEAKKKAISQGNLEDAAALSCILAPFLSMNGDQDGAVAAFREAENLDPANPYYVLSAARYLFDRGDFEVARAKAEPLLESSDLVARHGAFALLGRMHIRSGSTTENVISFLKGALDIARDSRLDPPLWDLLLVEDLIKRKTALGQCEEYLETLISRANEGGFVTITNRAEQLLLEVRA